MALEAICKALAGEKLVTLEKMGIGSAAFTLGKVINSELNGCCPYYFGHLSGKEYALVAKTEDFLLGFFSVNPDKMDGDMLFAYDNQRKVYVVNGLGQNRITVKDRKSEEALIALRRHDKAGDYIEDRDGIASYPFTGDSEDSWKGVHIFLSYLLKP
jgi:hypothetical protein